MARFAQRHRRGGGQPGTSGPLPPPGAPGAPTWATDEETAPAVWLTQFQLPVAYPAGATSWDLTITNATTPANNVTVTDALVGGYFIIYNNTSGEDVVATLTAWNADHTASTIGPSTTHTVGTPQQPDPPIFNSQIDNGDGTWNVLIESPAAYPNGSAEWDLLFSFDGSYPSLVKAFNMPVSSVEFYLLTPVGTVIKEVMRAWNADHDQSTDST